MINPYMSAFSTINDFLAIFDSDSQINSAFVV